MSVNWSSFIANVTSSWNILCMDFFIGSQCIPDEFIDWDKTYLKEFFKLEKIFKYKLVNTDDLFVWEWVIAQTKIIIFYLVFFTNLKLCHGLLRGFCIKSGSLFVNYGSLCSLNFTRQLKNLFCQTIHCVEQCNR